MNTKIAVQIALITHKIPSIWPIEVKKQLAKLHIQIPDKVKQKRIDLRSLPFVTIDNEDGYDLDDAVYCEKNNNKGWRLWVAIADVSYYVRPNTPLDHEAMRRSISIYFPSKVIPMLPERLSHELCSLNPKVDRLCLVCEMTISERGYLSSYSFYEAIMHSHARYTYDTVYKLIMGHKQDVSIHDALLIKPLIQLHKMYKQIEYLKLTKGVLYFDTEEIKFIFDNNNRIKRIESIKRHEAHKLIEEAMILANIAAAQFVEEHQEPILYRVHDRPSDENITLLRAILDNFGLTLGGGNKPDPQDYANMMKLISHRSDCKILQTLLLRSMNPAIYDSENRGHFGLSLQSYTHFTSPIRRYPDILVHRAIKKIIRKKQKKYNQCYLETKAVNLTLQEITYLGQHCSMNERRAEEATREVSDWLKCDFMKNYIGKIFQGTITNVTNFGCFVRLHDFCIDGLVHISSLEKDYYRYDHIGQKLIGTSKKKIYKIGDIVRIKVQSVHGDKRKIDFRLISKLY